MSAMFPRITPKVSSLSKSSGQFIKRLSALSSYSMSSQAMQPEEINVSKSSMKHTYIKETPLAYIEWLIPLDYGQFQDVFINFADPMINKLIKDKKQKNEKVKIVDLGCLYGNSSLALMDNKSWNETVSFWLNNDEEIKNKNEFDIIGVDLSEKALLYGLERGIYDKVFQQDFNSDFSDKLKDDIIDADIMICLMATNYMKQNVWNNIVNNIFLKDRSSKNKLLFYNQVCLFQHNDISPHLVLNENQNQWTSDRIFTKHRLLTPQESAANNSNKESWTYLYGVNCPKLNSE